MTRVHVFISGRVQGVFFRFHTRQKATELGINGWVRNTRDGRVEAVFEGEKEKVERMIRWCQRPAASAWGKGPSLAMVKKVEVVGEEAEGLKGFEIRF